MKKDHLVALVYIAVILLCIVYFGIMQQFGLKGLSFQMGGRDSVINPLDFLIVVATALAFFLFIISIIAYRRTKDARIMIVSLAFFFFAIHEFLLVLENFFPSEYIYIDHAERTLELLVLASFVMLMYGTYKRGEKSSKRARRS